ncbi:MAG TPA: hypothetical protein VGF30_09595, partial [Bacteroidia bacterium]
MERRASTAREEGEDNPKSFVNHDFTHSSKIHKGLIPFCLEGIVFRFFANIEAISVTMNYLLEEFSLQKS